MFTDKNFPKTFLSNNPSLREMVKDKGDFDRRLGDIHKREHERRQERKNTSDAGDAEIRPKTPRVFSSTTSHSNLSVGGYNRMRASPARQLPNYNSRPMYTSVLDAPPNSRSNTILSRQSTDALMATYRCATPKRELDNVMPNQSHELSNSTRDLLASLVRPYNTSCSVGLESNLAAEREFKGSTPRPQSRNNLSNYTMRYEDYNYRPSTPVRSYYTRPATPRSYEGTSSIRHPYDRSTPYTPRSITPSPQVTSSRTYYSSPTVDTNNIPQRNRPKSMNLDEFSQQEQLHTDKNFSKSFLSNSKPLCEMVLPSSNR